jgi:hypothetical protein
MSEFELRLSAGTLDALAGVITGDGMSGGNRVAPYRTKDELLNFLLATAKGVDETAKGLSRGKMVRHELQRWSGTPTLGRLLEAAVNPSEFIGKSVGVDVAVAHLNEHLGHEGYRLVRDAHGYRLIELTADVHARPETDPSTILTDAYVREQVDKCDQKLAGSDLDGAITNARTLVEAVLYALEDRLLETRTDFSGDLPKQFRHVAKLLRVDADRAGLDQRFKDVARGLLGAIHGLAPLRNGMSDAHARIAAPAPHHAALVVNAAKTVALFLVASFNFQVARGWLKPSGGAGGAPPPPSPPA